MLNFSKLEKNILKFWQQKRIFEKLRKKNRGKKVWSFLDGPITANNPMGVHHAWGRTYKDVFQRYKAMRGFDQRFQNGFDCQGLWVEVEVEKELGFKNKKDIEKYGIEKFVQKCKERVLKYAKIQTEQSIRLGQWMDWKNSYFTMSDENNYAIWYFLKKCWQQGLLYKGKDVVPWCPRCATAISQHEILTEDYQEITHQAIFFKLPVGGQKNTYFLVWTTTPWTLPGNVALAVHPELGYVKVKDSTGNMFIVLREKAHLIERGKIIESFKGKKLQGVKYGGPFDQLPAVKKALANYKHAVILWKEINIQEGTGIVHIAPGCGRDDYQLSQQYNLPVIDLTDEESRYKQGFGLLGGKLVFEKEIRACIFEMLKQKNFLFKIEDYQHRYPVCWRCKTELIFRLVDEWYISMKELRTPLIKIAKEITWLPSFGKDREIDWLSHMGDWLISKKRYWGLALPIFECQKCGHFSVIGSKQELKEKAVEGWPEFEGRSPHRPWVDKIKIRCSECGAKISRVPDVGNPWLDAGIVPFSTISSDNRLKNPPYFKKTKRARKEWQKWFPVDFICESFPGQFKNWFYSLLVMSYVLEKTKPSKTIFGYASVVDEKGEEMHKSKGNAIWFDEAVEKIGADVMRWLYVKQNPVYNLRFGYNITAQVKRKLLTLWNCYLFFETYALRKMSNAKKWHISTPRLKTQNLLDAWIISRLNGLILEATKSLDKYDAAAAAKAIEDFVIEDLSLWYIRRSRRRFQQPKSKEELDKASQTLAYILLKVSQLTAPFIPFLSEEIYQKLKGSDMPESVHLNPWPQANKKALNKKLEKEMTEIRQIISQALAKRAELQIKVRQPLQKLKIKSEKLKVNHQLLELIKKEVNVKEVVFDPTIKEKVWLDAKITSTLKEEGLVREVIRQIQERRKELGLTPKDKIAIYYQAKPELNKILEKNRQLILRETKAKSFQLKKGRAVGFEKKIKIEQTKMGLTIEKI